MTTPGPDRLTGPDGRSQTLRTVVGLVVVAVAIAAALVALFHNRHEFVHGFDRIGPWAMLASGAFGLLGVGATYPIWRAVLGGLGVAMPWGEGATVYFTTQLGKYLPGSVWPAVMQMETGRRRGASRPTMLWANLSSLLINCAVGLIVACVLLPVYDASAFGRYWWVLLAVPALVGALHPKVLPALINRILVLLRRGTLSERVQPRAELRAAGWATLSWVGFGGHLAVLVVASGPSGFGSVARSIGAIALAVPLGVLFVPAPAGAGIREVILLLVLRTMMGSGDALAVVVTSRALLLLCDLLLAGGAALPRLWRLRPAATG